MKTTKKFALLLTLLFVLSASLLGCGGQSLSDAELEKANAVTDNVLAGISEKDYAIFSRDFSDEMKAAMNEESFTAFAESLDENLGRLQSKSVTLTSKINQMDQTILVANYEATYEKDPVPVNINMQLIEKDGESILIGMSFESPALEG